MPTNEQWIANHIKALDAKSSLTADQQQFMELAGKTERTKAEERQFKTVLKIEKAKDELAKAKRQQQRDQQSAKGAARKARDHELYNSAGLLILSGLVDTRTGLPVIDKAELLGALTGLANVPADDPRRAEWKKAGNERLKQQDKNKKAETA